MSGSRTGSPVLLASGRVFYTYSDVTQIAPMHLAIHRTYVSDGRNGKSTRPSSFKYDVKFDDGTKMSKVFKNN